MCFSLFLLSPPNISRSRYSMHGLCPEADRREMNWSSFLSPFLSTHHIIGLGTIKPNRLDTKSGQAEFLFQPGLEKISKKQSKDSLWTYHQLFLFEGKLYTSHLIDSTCKLQPPGIENWSLLSQQNLFGGSFILLSWLFYCLTDRERLLFARSLVK